ncbi:MAG: hypothetical protein IT334_11420 [Thermomicrobiales bacterium]|nr:hypothetical protein [Thermomicrobiales bacterium]
MLPITEWEDAYQRLVLPERVQISLALDQAVIRWARVKRAQVLNEHPSDVADIERIEELMKRLLAAGRDPRKNRSEFLLFCGDDRKMFRVVIGLDKAGSLNIVTVFATDREKEIRRWKRLFFPMMTLFKDED